MMAANQLQWEPRPDPDWGSVQLGTFVPGALIPAQEDNQPWWSWLAEAPPVILRVTYENQLKGIGSRGACYQLDGHKDPYRVTLLKNAALLANGKWVPLPKGEDRTKKDNEPLVLYGEQVIKVRHYAPVQHEMRVPVEALLARINAPDVFFTFIKQRSIVWWLRSGQDPPVGAYVSKFNQGFEFTIDRSCPTKRCAYGPHYYIRTSQQPRSCEYKAKCPGCWRPIHCKATRCPHHWSSEDQPTGNNYQWSGNLNDIPDHCNPELRKQVLKQIRDRGKNTKKQKT